MVRPLAVNASESPKLPPEPPDESGDGPNAAADWQKMLLAKLAHRSVESRIALSSSGLGAGGEPEKNETVL